MVIIKNEKQALFYHEIFWKQGDENMPLPITSILLLAMEYVSRALDSLLSTSFFTDYFSVEALNEFAYWWITSSK